MASGFAAAGLIVSLDTRKMTQPKLVLVTVAVLLKAPVDETAMDERMSAVGDAMQDSVRAFAAAQPDCAATGVTTYHYPGEDYENAFRCAKCGVWASDFKKPDELDGIGSGSVVDGRFLCTQCYNHKPV